MLKIWCCCAKEIDFFYGSPFTSILLFTLLRQILAVVVLQEGITNRKYFKEKIARGWSFPSGIWVRGLREGKWVPALDHRQDHGAVSFLHRRKLWLDVPTAQEIDAGVRTGRGEGWSRHVGTCFQEDRTVAKLLGAWTEPHSQGADAVPCSRWQLD